MTIKDVAEHSGVSVSTVSRVLNEHPDVSKAVREKVLASVQELHYVPNSSARDLVRPQADVIGVIARGVSNPFFSPVLLSIEQEISRSGYTMVLNQIITADDELTAAAALIRSKRLRGVILLGGRFDYTPEEAASLDVPFVCCSFTNSFGSLDRGRYASVSINDEQEAQRAVDLLIKRGHRKIAVLLTSMNDRSISQLRYRGYCDALRSAGIEPDPTLCEEIGEYSMEAAYTGMKRLLQRNPDFTALFTIADSFGIAAIKALQESGRRIPEDCALISIDGIEMSQYTIPTLSTLIQPADTMGTETVRILIDMIEGRREGQDIRLETVLRQGCSLG